jgi:mRNA-degrading endonuclease RelE of RelBE toxin-antitoxin system
MSATVLETGNYRRKAARLLSEAERVALRANLAENPEAHDVIPGLGGLRKARWGQESRGKGKRGGVRIIYFYALTAGIVALIDIYSKAEKKDLNEIDKKWLKRELAEIKGAI